MLTLLFKMAAIIALTHGLRIIGKAAGPRWSGLILGLPASTAIVLFFYAQEQGVGFAAKSADSALLGLLSATTFALIVAAFQVRGWSIWLSLGLGTAGYLACSCTLSLMVLDFMLLRIPLVLGFLFLAHIWISRRSQRSPTTVEAQPSQREFAWFKVIALRTLVPVACLLMVMAIAAPLGPVWAGLIGTYPSTLVAVLIVTSIESGSMATAKTAEAFPLGNFCMVAFIATFRFGAEALGVGWAMGLGYGAAFLVLALVEALRRRESDSVSQNAIKVDAAVSSHGKDITGGSQAAAPPAASVLAPV